MKPPIFTATDTRATKIGATVAYLSWWGELHFAYFQVWRQQFKRELAIRGSIRDYLTEDTEDHKIPHAVELLLIRSAIERQFAADTLVGSPAEVFQRSLQRSVGDFLFQTKTTNPEARFFAFDNQVTAGRKIVLVGHLSRSHIPELDKRGELWYINVADEPLRDVVLALHFWRLVRRSV